MVSFVLAVSVSQAAPCAAPTTLDALVADYPIAQSLARASDVTAGDAARRVIGDLTCLSEPLKGGIIGPAYRAIGAAAITGGDEATARQWFRAALVADPNGAFGTEDLPSDHPAMAVFAAIRDEGSRAATVDPTRALQPGTWLLDGKTITAVSAREGMPHVLQRVDASGVSTWLIDGLAFPEDAVTKAVAVAEAAGPACPPHKPWRRYAKPGVKIDVNGDCKADILPPRPLEKTPLILAGTTLLAGAGGIYGLATTSRAQFEAATVLGDVERYQALTNHLVVATGVVGVVGLASLGWGVIVSDEGTVMPRVSGRF